LGIHGVGKSRSFQEPGFTVMEPILHMTSIIAKSPDDGDPGRAHRGEIENT
jgi:hypothetical protein